MRLPDLYGKTPPTNIDTDVTNDDQVESNRPEDIEHVVLEPLDQNPYDLFYTCLLIPRFTSHILTGDLAQRLPGWLHQICISFGWRLEKVTVKPEYFQWVLCVPPVTSASYFMKTIRQQTSVLIFDEFPHYKKKNPSKDFWAPGYLIYFGSQPHSKDVIQNFINHTRRQQGILLND